jgi:tetratricopeptide (TPR) repeat protein
VQIGYVLCCFPSIRETAVDNSLRRFAEIMPGFFWRSNLSALIRITILIFTILLAASYAAMAQSEPASQKPHPPDDAQSLSPKTPAPDFDTARKLMQEGKYDEALAQLQLLAAQNPKLTGLSHEMGAAYYKKGDYLKATGYLKQALEENPKDNEAVQLLGLSYYLSGRPNEAIPLLEKVQTWYPFANVDAAYILGVSYIQVKNYPQARVAFAHMFDVPADSAASYLFTARMLLRQEFDPIAEEYAQKAVAIDPKLPLAHFLLGELYLYKSRIPEAITEFEKEKAINPAHAPIYYKLADAYSRIQKFDDAERLLQRSIWLDATSTGPYILMGKVLEKKGEFDLAVRALQRAVTMDPNNSITHHLLGQAYRDLGRNDEAERELKSAEQLQERESNK